MKSRFFLLPSVLLLLTFFLAVHTETTTLPIQAQNQPAPLLDVNQISRQPEDVQLELLGQIGGPSYIALLPPVTNISVGQEGLSQTTNPIPVRNGSTGRIAFASDRDGDFEIYAMNTDGLGLIQLTNNSFSDTTPSWSPDGSKITFSSNRDGNFEIYVMNANGSGSARLTNDSANDHSPTWSPDNSKIAFVSDRDSNTPDIYVMNTDSLEVIKLTNSTWYSQSPDWSPDGSKIAYAFGGGIESICVMNSDGSGQTCLTDSLGPHFTPAWSPDGSKFALSAIRDDYVSLDIYTMNADGSNLERLTDNLAWDSLPVWSPDGTKIAFTSSRDNNLEIYVMNLDGTSQTNLTNNTAEDSNPSWAPFQSCAAANPNVQPLMLVTGWGGSIGVTDLAQDEQLLYFEDHLDDLGYVEGCNLFYATDTSPYLYLDENAVVIQSNFCAAYDQVETWNPGWNGHFDIIAHSYGGLRARAYLENDALYGQNCPGTQNRVYVNNLFTMGTPHGGEPYLLPGDLLPFATYIGFCAIAPQICEPGNPGGPEWPALVEMLPPTRLVQNLSSSEPDDVCYYLLAGDARTQILSYPPRLLALFTGWPSDSVRLDGNDFAVHQDSADVLNSFVYSRLYPQTIAIYTDDLHGQIPEEVIGEHDLLSFVNPNTTFLQEIWPHVG